MSNAKITEKGKKLLTYISSLSPKDRLKFIKKLLNDSNNSNSAKRFCI